MAKSKITMDELAKLAQVSKPTVSRALSGNPLVSPKTRDHVLAVAKKHGYAVNRNAQKLREERSNTIVVSVDFRSHRKNHISDPFILELLAGVSDALGERNQDLLLCAPGHNDYDSLNHLINSGTADGFIFLGQGRREDLLAEMAKQGLPVVVWGARTSASNYCVVGGDNYLGGQLAGEYLVKHKQRKRIAFLGNTGFSEISLRWQGVSSVCEAYGATVFEVPLPDFEYETALAEIANLFSEPANRPDAVLAWNDTAAIAAISALQLKGFSVPGDVNVVGYNDIPIAKYFSPHITTIRQDTSRAGELLVEKLMSLLEGGAPSSEALKTELIIRKT